MINIVDPDYPNVMIGCPVCPGKEYVLPDYLEHIYNLDYPKTCIDIVFLINYHQDQDPSHLKDIIHRFQDKTSKHYNQVIVKEVTTPHSYADNIPGRNMNRRFRVFAAIRNKWLSLMGDDIEYVFSVDSDILVPKHSLKQLLSRDKDIVSVLIENGPMYDPEIHPARVGHFMTQYNWWPYHRRRNWWNRVSNHGRVACNVMMKTPPEYEHPQNEYDKFEYVHVDPSYLYGLSHQNYNPQVARREGSVNLLDGPFITPTEVGGLPEVDMTGAAYLINRRVLNAGVVYGYHHQGEDPYFCAMAQDLGFKLFCDIFLPADHIMTPQIFEHRRNFLEQMKVIRPVPRILRKGVPEYVVPVLQAEPDVEVVLKEVN